MSVVPFQKPLAVDGKPPVHDLEVEAATLAACMEHPDVAATAMSIAGFDDYYSAMHREIARAISALLDAGQVTSTENVLLRLRETNRMSIVGGERGVRQMVASVASVSSLIERYAGRVRDMAHVRRVCLTMQRIVAECYEPIENVDAFLAKVDNAVSLVTHRTGKDGVSSMLEIAKSLSREYAMPARKTITTGIVALDKMTRGFEQHGFYVLGARTSMGKSAIAMQMVASAAEAGHRVLVVSMEMTQNALLRRIACARARVSMTAARDREMTPDQFSRLNYEIAQASRWPAYSTEGRSKTILDIKSAVKKYKPALVVVDHIGLLEAPADGSTARRSREQEVALFSRSLKNMAMESEIAVLALCQIGRGPAKDGKRPALTDLRESGSIEQDADSVWLLHRPGYYTPGASPEEMRVAEINVAKQRDGATGLIAMEWIAERAAFREPGATE